MDKLNPVREGLQAAFRAVDRSPGMGGFITGACFVEWIATFYFGRRVFQDDYKRFARKFLPKYDAARLYHGIRCGLVHFYSEHPGPFHDFREDRPGTHLQKIPIKGGSKEYLLVLNLSNFKADLRRAMNDLLRFLERDASARKRAIARYRKVGLISGKVETI